MAAQNVLFVQPSAEAGGSEAAMTRLVTQLDPARYRPVVVLPERGPVASEVEAAGVEVRVLPMAQLHNTANPSVQARFAAGYRGTARALARLAQECDAAIVHSNSLYSLYGALACRKIGGPRHVWHVREIIDAPLPVRAGLIRLARRRADRLLCVSGAVADQFEAAGKTIVCHDGVDTEAFSPRRSGGRVRAELGIPDEAPVVGWIARLDPWKGADVFISVAERIRREKPETHFLICGAQLPAHRDYAARIQDRARGSLGDSVHLALGKYRGPGEMPEVYAALDVLVHTATSPEPFGLVLIEAMATGKPVVAARAGGPLEIVEPGVTGELIRPGDVTAYADAVLGLLKDPQAAAAMGRTGRQRCKERFSVQRNATQIQEIYDSVLGREQPRSSKPAHRLSVITVNYNGGPELTENVAAWWHDRDPDWHLTVVDNASSDESVAQLSVACPGVEVIRNAVNTGFTAATNQALRGDRSPFVLLLNPDVRVEASGIRLAIDYLQANREVGIVGARMVLPSGNVDPAAHRSFKTPATYLYKMTGLAKMFPGNRRFGQYYRGDIDDSAAEPIDVDSVTGAFLMVRRQVIEDIGLLDENFFMYCEDEDWCWRAKRHGWRVVYHPGIEALHRKGSSAKQRQLRTTWEWHRSLWLYHRKNIAPDHSLPVNFAVYAGIGGVLAGRLPLIAAKQVIRRLRR